MKIATGQVIKAFRMHLNYKQEYIGAKINVSANVLSSIENGRVGLDLEKLYKISDLFGVPPRVLLQLIIEIFESKESAIYLDNAIKKLVSYPIIEKDINKPSLLNQSFKR